MPERWTSILSVRGLRRTFGELAAVDGLDLDLPPGECVALIGHNGSGKTTAPRVMGGRLEPTAGTVTVNGADVHDRRRGHIARVSLAFVPDAPGCCTRISRSASIWSSSAWPTARAMDSTSGSTYYWSGCDCPDAPTFLPDTCPAACDRRRRSPGR
jgi:ABC-type branched-subunit amino acid transport system ATPase component